MARSCLFLNKYLLHEESSLGREQQSRFRTADMKVVSVLVPSADTGYTCTHVATPEEVTLHQFIVTYCGNSGYKWAMLSGFTRDHCFNLTNF